MGMSLSGLGSGFDWKSVVDQLRQVENQRLNTLNTKKKGFEDKLSAWDSLNSKLMDFQKAVQDLQQVNDFDLFRVGLSSSSSVAAETILSASTGYGAAAGQYDLEIIQMARAEKIQSSSVASSRDSAGWTGQITLNGVSIELDGKSLTALRDEINTLNARQNPTGVSASILQVSSNDYRLILTSTQTGSTGIDLTDASGDYFVDTPLQEGTDAIIKVDGAITVTRTSNTIADVIPGVVLSLKGESPGTRLTLKMERDSDAIQERVQKFVDAYNGIGDYLRKQMSFDATSKKAGGALFGESMLRTLKTSLQGVLSDSGLTSMGIKIDRENTLSLESEKLKELLDTDLSGTIGRFNAMSSSIDALLDRSTDSIDGTLSRRKNSLNASIRSVEKKITRVQDQIDMKIESLTRRFIALDTAMNQMQSQSQWLSTQLASLSSS